MNDTKTVFAVMSNTDLTEGRGRQYIKHLCELEATAIRLGKGEWIQGANCPVHEVDLFLHESVWYGPVSIEAPSTTDFNAEKILIEKRKLQQKRDAVLVKAAELGLSEEEISLLKNMEKGA